MIHHTDLIVYLWLAPIFFLLLLPLVLTIANFLLTQARQLFFTKEIITEEKRKHPRFASCEGTLAQVTVGDTTCTALVSDISPKGIRLKHLPGMFSYKINKLSVVIRQYGVDYNLLVKTKWTELKESGKQIGAEIDTASPGWSQFLLQTKNSNQPEPV